MFSPYRIKSHKKLGVIVVGDGLARPADINQRNANMMMRWLYRRYVGLNFTGGHRGQTAVGHGSPTLHGTNTNATSDLRATT